MKILLPIDDSTVANSAVERILAQAWPADTEFKVITVLEPLEQILPGPDPQYMPHGRIVRQQRVDAAIHLIRAAAARLEARFTPCSVRFEILEGLAADRIVTTASEWCADLIVIASHGRTGVSRFVLGSVAEAVVLRAPCSVEVVQPLTARTARESDARPVENVLIAIDTTDLASNVVSEVIRRSWPETCCFKVITVLKSLYAADMGYSAVGALEQLDELEKAEQGARAILNEQSKQLAARYGQSRVSSELLKGSVKSTILQEAKRWRAGLIVVGSHGRRGLGLCLLGSTALGVLEEAPCSVFVVKISRDLAHDPQLSSERDGTSAIRT